MTIVLEYNDLETINNGVSVVCALYGYTNRVILSCTFFDKKGSNVGYAAMEWLNNIEKVLAIASNIWDLFPPSANG